MELIAAVVREARIEDLNSLFLLVQKTKEHEFLFGPEIGKYIDEIYKKGVELHERSIVGDEPNFAKRTELVTWFSEQTNSQDRDSATTTIFANLNTFYNHHKRSTADTDGRDCRRPSRT